MLDLVKNVAEIAKITNYRGWLLASDEVCPEKTYVSAKKYVPKSPSKCPSFREIVGTWLLSHLLPQKLVWWQACSVSVISRWVGGSKFDLDYVSEVMG